VRSLAIAQNPAFLAGAADRLASRQMWLQALRYYLAALQQSPGNANLRQAMQETLYRAGNIAMAELLLQGVVAAAPNWGVGLAAWGRWEILNGRGDPGAADIDKAKALPEEGHSPFVQAVWAECLYRQGDKSGAQAAAKAVHGDPRTPRWLDRELSKVVTQ
jgi:tetratricopeptide (TPR) repeat protein